MIADAFFAFLSWLRLLFFNREMELALIGTTTTTTVLVLYSDVSSMYNAMGIGLEEEEEEGKMCVSLSLSLSLSCRRKVDERALSFFLSFFLSFSARRLRLVSVSGTNDRSRGARRSGE